MCPKGGRFFMKLKEPKTYTEQVQLLKDKGFIIQNEKEILEFLKSFNYYKFSAFLLPFKLSEDVYEKVDISVPCNMFTFDCKLRVFLFEVIQYIELDIKSKLSYFFSHKYGALGYKDKSNFSEKHDWEKFNSNVEEIKKKNSKNLIIKHHCKKYNSEIPFWALIDFFTFTQLSIFFSDLKTQDQKKFLKENYTKTNISNQEYKSWLKCISLLRNMTAHFSRIYFIRFSQIPNFHPKRNIFTNGRLIDILYAMKFIFPFPELWNEKILTKLGSLIKEYKN